MKKIRKFLKILGPGFVTGASDDDPSGIVTYSQTGAIFGFAQAWTSLFTFPLMTVVQEMCGRIGLVTGHGLAGVIKRNYSKKTLYPLVVLLLIANTVNIGVDLGAMAASAKLIFGAPFVVWIVVMVVLSLSLEVFLSYKIYAKYLKYLTLALFSYVAVAFIVKIDWGSVLVSTLIPTLEPSRTYIVNIVAILGTTISPYLFFWQAEEEVEDEVARNKIRDDGLPPVIAKADIKNLRIDTAVGMFLSNIVMFFIIVTAGATLHANGIFNIESADQAALVLRPIGGDFAFVLFALGIIGTGFLAVPILAGSASYAISEVLGWSAGLTNKTKKAKGFYSIIIVSTLVGVLINFIGINPMAALYYTAVLNGIIAPPLLFAIVVVANDKNIMGEKVNSKFSNILGGFTVLIMAASALILVLTL